MKCIHRVGLAIGVAALGLAPAAANHSWNGYHWARTANPLVLRANGSLTGPWATHVNTALSDWAQSSVLDFSPATYVPVSVSPKRCAPIAGQVLVCNETYGQRGWLGIASIWLNGNHITQATTKLNDTYFNMPQYNTAGWRQFVACQEIGHDFGLDHQDEGFSNVNLGTCMDYTNDPARNDGKGDNLHPNKHDYDELVTIYTHLDTTNTATLSSATNFGIREVGKPVPQPDDGAGNTMAEWGRAVRFDRRGRPDMFVRQLPDGRKVVTHVLWALEAKATEAR
jgi:hypothetical protein